MDCFVAALLVLATPTQGSARGLGRSQALGKPSQSFFEHGSRAGKVKPHIALVTKGGAVAKTQAVGLKVPVHVVELQIFNIEPRKVGGFHRRHALTGYGFDQASITPQRCEQFGHPF